MKTENNVVEHQTAIWDRLKKNADTEQHHSQKARELWPVIAADMVTLRQQYPSDPLFGGALVEHGIEYDKNTRAAYIHLGLISPEALIDAMDLCKSRSSRYLSAWVKDTAKKDDYFTITNSDSNLPPKQEAPEVPETQPEPTVSAEKPEQKKPVHGKIADKYLRKFYTNPGTRGLLSKLSVENKNILIDILKTNKFGTSSAVAVTKISPRLFVSKLSGSWPVSAKLVANPTKPKEVKIIFGHADNYLRLAEIVGDDCTSPNRCDAVWRNQIIAAKVRAPIAPAAVVTKAYVTTHSFQAEPDNEGQIVVHGVQIWPPSEHDHYDFGEAWAAYHLWDDLNKLMMQPGGDAEARGRHLMEESIFLEYGSFQYSIAFRAICVAQHLNPGSTDTKAPRRKDRFK